MRKISLLLVTFLIPVIGFGDWDIEIPYADSSGRSASIALDSNNEPHILYFADADSFYYIYKSNDSWFGPYSIEKVDYSTYCRVVDLTVIADTAYAIMCMEYTTSGDYLLWGKHMGGGIWFTEQIPNTVVPSNSGGYLNVAITPGTGSTLFHAIYVFYNYGSPVLYYRSYDGSWTDAEVVGDIPNVSAGWQNDIAADGNNDPHVAFVYSDEGIKYRKKTGSIWEPIELVATATDPTFVSIAVDAWDYPHVVYDKDDFSAVCYRSKSAAGWQSEETIGTGGGWNTYGASIGVYGWGRSVAYYSDGDLEYATRLTSNWMHEFVDTTGDVGTYASLAIDSEGYPHIAYRDATQEFLKYAKSTNPMTGFDEIDTGSLHVHDDAVLYAFPNPFNGKTEITYHIPVDHYLTSLELYDAAGRLVTSFHVASGTVHSTISWSGCDSKGNTLNKGVYFLRGMVRSLSESKEKEVLSKLLIL